MFPALAMRLTGKGFFPYHSASVPLTAGRFAKK
jgi:hypothetical protein